jgi:ArsR family transcriptional regulator
MHISAYKDVLIMENLTRVFSSLSDETRLRMLGLLLERKCCVCEVMEVLGISQTRASRNLQILYEAGLLHRHKQGLWAYYSIDKMKHGKSLAPLVDSMEVLLSANKQVKADRRALAKKIGTNGECCR